MFCGNMTKRNVAKLNNINRDGRGIQNLPISQILQNITWFNVTGLVAQNMIHISVLISGNLQLKIKT